ncbi:ferredoxin--NADP reductase [Bordetella bronchialis]|uniref:ferredoxin--NADP(+) reductase n=1 Tax=Bordetella bronchialis TaxID=463025 RepID=A0A193FVB4_9BORD|nr:ferredoxin--NADP reductase [Bordetella bronchialis]ANN71278.1 ferredoxin--NADP(+) reductase [Bordetella bronchialis]
MPESKYTRQTVTEVRTWVPGKLFSLRVTRDPGFVYKAGQFARVGLPESDAPDAVPTLWRAYSMVSGPLDHELEFYSIVVPDGPFSPRLAALKPGDALYIEKNPYGFLTIDRFLAPGSAGPSAGYSDLWLLATGTGLSAYLSILRDPATWTAFRRIILIHGVRTAQELAYRQEIEGWSTLPEFADIYRADPRKLIYLPIATQEALPGMPQARLTTLIQDGRLETLVGERLDPAHSKVMLCGNPAMLADARKLLGEKGFAPGRRGVPGNLAVENYW